jgi:RNA polymerase-binding transcription factor DksA
MGPDAEGPNRPTTVPGMELDHSDLLDDAEQTLDDVDRTLGALDEGSFGACTSCGARIEDAVLIGAPTRQLCEPCSASGSKSPESISGEHTPEDGN